MTTYQKVKSKLAAREPVTIANLMLLESPLLLDALSDMDCILLDKEHGLYGTEELVPLTMRCRQLGIPSIIRVEDSIYHLIAKSIDLGADGIMLPRVESVEQVRTAVEAMHLAPVGRTGFGGWGILREEETLSDFQNGRIFLPQIESERGMLAIPEILAQYDAFIDGFMIGPNDYSISMGCLRDFDSPVMLKQIQSVFDVCRKYGKSCGCFAADAEHARLYREMGANIFWLGDDKTYIRMGVRSLLDDIFRA